MNGIQTTGKFKTLTGGNIDYYYGGGGVAYETIADALELVRGTMRIGRTVGIKNNIPNTEMFTIDEYSWQGNSIEDSDLSQTTESKIDGLTGILSIDSDGNITGVNAKLINDFELVYGVDSNPSKYHIKVNYADGENSAIDLSKLTTDVDIKSFYLTNDLTLNIEYHNAPSTLIDFSKIQNVSGDNILITKYNREFVNYKYNFGYNNVEIQNKFINERVKSGVNTNSKLLISGDETLNLYYNNVNNLINVDNKLTSNDAINLLPIAKLNSADLANSKYNSIVTSFKVKSLNNSTIELISNNANKIIDIDGGVGYVTVFIKNQIVDNYSCDLKLSTTGAGDASTGISITDIKVEFCDAHATHSNNKKNSYIDKFKFNNSLNLINSADYTQSIIDNGNKALLLSANISKSNIFNALTIHLNWRLVGLSSKIIEISIHNTILSINLNDSNYGTLINDVVYFYDETLQIIIIKNIFIENAENVDEFDINIFADDISNQTFTNNNAINICAFFVSTDIKVSKDFVDYLNLYKLNVSSTNSGNVQGPAGPQGIQGLKGDDGATGPQGIQGLKGDKGDKGDDGATGPQGIQGLKGDKGDKGDDGATGPQGIQGLKGDKGDKGDAGTTGPQGIQGLKGDKGDKGDAGTTGPQGIQGLKGDKGDDGATGPQGIQGLKGDDGATGPQGIQGLKGDKGDDGATGPQGIQGLKGDKGDKGDDGATGPQGIQGLKGDDAVAVFGELVFIDGASPVLDDITLSTTEKEYRLVKSTFFGRTYFVTNSINREDFSHSIIKIDGLSTKVELTYQIFRFQNSDHPTDLKVWAVVGNLDTQDLVDLNAYNFDFWNTSYKEGAVTVNNYNFIPFREGQYILSNGLSAFSNACRTKIKSLNTGVDVLFKDIQGVGSVYVKREIRENLNNNDLNVVYFRDSIYDTNDVLIAQIGSNSYEVGLSLNFVRVDIDFDFFKYNFKDNYRFNYKKENYYAISFKNEIYTDNNSVKSEKSYVNLPFSQKNLSVTINGEDATGAVKVGLLSRNDTITDDFIAFEPNEFWTKERLQGASVVIEFEDGDVSARIPTVSKENYTGVNAALAESTPYHGGKMMEVFGNAYGNYTAGFVNGIPDNVNDVGVENLRDERYIQDTLISANANIVFGAQGNFNTYQKLKYPTEVFKVFPNGSNSLVREDNRFDNITQFITNGVLVTSRADDDLNASDPKGTSYGFGVEFNEPTLNADMLAGGYNWTSDTTDEHQQSPATAIVAGKLKYIKDQTGAPWYLVREAARQTASHANNYNIYTGFGVIDKAAAITWLSGKEWEDSNKKYALEESIFNLRPFNSAPFLPETWGYPKIRVSGSLVTLSGVIRLTENSTVNGIIFVIPEHLKPNRETRHLCTYTSGSTLTYARIDVNRFGNGVLRMPNNLPAIANGDQLNLNGCSYLIDGTEIE